MRKLGLFLLVTSIVSILASFTVDFGQLQMYLAALSLLSASFAACLLVQAPHRVAVEREGPARTSKSPRITAEALIAKFEHNVAVAMRKLQRR